MNQGAGIKIKRVPISSHDPQDDLKSHCPAKDNLWTISVWGECIGPECSTVFPQEML